MGSDEDFHLTPLKTLLLAGALTLVLGQKLLAQPDGLRRHFHQLIVVNKLQRLLKRELDGGHQADDFILAGGTHVVELFSLSGVHHQVIVPAMNTTQLPFIDLLPRIQEQLAAALQGFQRVGQRGTRSHRHNDAVLAAGNVPNLDRAIVAERGRKDAST